MRDDHRVERCGTIVTDRARDTLGPQDGDPCAGEVLGDVGGGEQDGVLRIPGPVGEVGRADPARRPGGGAVGGAGADAPAPSTDTR